MITTKQVRWGSYRQYSGAFYRGDAPYKLTANPSESAKTMAVITAAEGGHFNSVNAYDRCIFTLGLLQFCEAGQYSASDLLGALAEASPDLLDPLKPALQQAKARFGVNKKGRHRFFFLDSRGEVDTTDEQHQLFQLHADGTTESWDEASTEYVKQWVACAANTLAQPEAWEPQINFTARKLMGFVRPAARGVLWDSTPNTGLVAAVRAAYTSFAVNLPAVADRQLKAALAKTKHEKWSEGWCLDVLRELTFGSGISIYPRRYNVMRPVLETLYKVDLPDLSDELKVWQAKLGIDPQDKIPTFMDVQEVQEELLAQGFDLGPSGADGVLGPKTREDLRTFQSQHGIYPSGAVDQETRKALGKEWGSRNP